MAIFASTTLGSSDPAKAMNIKVLEARAQALAAAQAKQEMPTSMPSPWQGAGYLANTVADAVLTKRADQQAQQQRQQLGDIISQVGPEGPNPQQQAGITARDTDLGKMYATQAFQARQGAEELAARKEAAAQKAQADQDYLQKQETLLQGRPQTDQAKVKADLTAGRISQEEADAALKKLNAGSPAEQKFISEQQSANIDLQASGQGLDKALELLDTGKVYSDSGLAGLRIEHGQSVPKPLQGITGVDPESTDISKRYSQIMNAQVLPILNKLKGSMSNADREWAIATINNPSSTIGAKKDVLRMLKVHLDAELKQSNINLKNTGAAAVQVAPPATVAPGQPAAGGPQSVASEADALKLPPGTKFKLPDGRTGTAR
jgi:hypothetical protein